jgi:hypothetical protein
MTGEKYRKTSWIVVIQSWGNEAGPNQHAYSQQFFSLAINCRFDGHQAAKSHQNQP